MKILLYSEYIKVTLNYVTNRARPLKEIQKNISMNLTIILSQ